MAEKKKGFFGEFKAFVLRGNVMDMAIGVIVATAFGKITTSLINDVFMPFIGWLIGDIDLSRLNIVLRPAVTEGETVVSEAVVIGIGAFLTAVIDFLLIALIVFCIIKAMNKAHERAEARRKAAEPAPEPEPEPGPSAEALLSQILEELKKK